MCTLWLTTPHKLPSSILGEILYANLLFGHHVHHTLEIQVAMVKVHLQKYEYAFCQDTVMQKYILHVGQPT